MWRGRLRRRRSVNDETSECSSTLPPGTEETTCATTVQATNTQVPTTTNLETFVDTPGCLATSLHVDSGVGNGDSDSSVDQQYQEDTQLAIALSLSLEKTSNNTIDESKQPQNSRIAAKPTLTKHSKDQDTSISNMKWDADAERTSNHDWIDNVSLPSSCVSDSVGSSPVKKAAKGTQFLVTNTDSQPTAASPSLTKHTKSLKDKEQQHTVMESTSKHASNVNPNASVRRTRLSNLGKLTEKQYLQTHTGSSSSAESLGNDSLDDSDFEPSLRLSRKTEVADLNQDESSATSLSEEDIEIPIMQSRVKRKAKNYREQVKEAETKAKTRKGLKVAKNSSDRNYIAQLKNDLRKNFAEAGDFVWKTLSIIQEDTSTSLTNNTFTPSPNLRYLNFERLKYCLKACNIDVEDTEVEEMLKLCKSDGFSTSSITYEEFCRIFENVGLKIEKHGRVW